MTGADQVTEAGQPGSPGIVCLSDGLAVTSQPVVVAYGGGTNSTALLVGMLERGERPDLILFADTGGEKPGTYTHTATVSDWCMSVGFPRIETVRYANKAGQVITLYDKCISGKMLPSIAYGFKSCSEKWKRRPQDRYVSQWAPAQAEVLRKYLPLGPEFDAALADAYADKERAVLAARAKAREEAARSTDVLTFAPPTRKQHPCEKPVPLIERLALAVPTAHHITDYFMGSGTTGVACVRMGRKFTGIERDARHFDTACRRIEDAGKQGALIQHDQPVQEGLL